VAVKVVELAAGPLGTTGVSLRRVRFEREARSLARLGGHPGVPCVVALGVDLDGVAWMVNEFVVGPTLADRVLGGDPLDADEAVAVLVGAAEALATAHEHGVVHGDVSPANVVLGSTGPVLVDFGVGGLDGDGGDAAITPLVASPERLAGAGPSTADDTHALAATIRWSMCPRAVLPASVEARLDACVAPSAAERPTAAALAVALGGRGTTRSGWGRRASRR
jgi:serine/threonine protein kinase